MKNKLDEARKSINEIDAQMAKLFEKRMEAVKAIAEHKASLGLEIYDAAREDEVIRKGKNAVENSEICSYYVSFLKNTMAVSRAYQESIIKGMKVAYSGTEGAFAHIATGRLFPSARKIATAILHRLIRRLKTENAMPLCFPSKTAITVRLVRSPILWHRDLFI